MKQTNHKFKIGDRVVYHAVHFGNNDLDGMTGTIVMVDNTGCPYTVRLDEPYIDSVRDTRIKGNKNHDRLWWCQEENLALLEDSQTNQETQDESEKEEMANIKWTDEEVEKLKEFVRAGRSRAEMMAYFGYNSKSIENKVSALRKADPTLPGGYRKKEKTEAEPTAPEQESKLNDLEQAMSEVITEKEGEIDKLKGDIKVLQDKLEAAETAKAELECQNQILSDRVKELEGELRDTLDALNMTETRLDEELKTLREQSEQTGQTEDSNMKTIAALEKENTRLANMVFDLVERLLRGGESL